MTAGAYNFTIEQGAKFSRVLTWKNSAGTPINISGYTAELKIVADIDGLSVPIITLTTTPDIHGNGITLGGSAGTITILIKSVTTAAMTFSEGRYDLELIDGTGEVSRLIRGSVSLSPETNS